jgi:methyl-accepting chemotaxis protein
LADFNAVFEQGVQVMMRTTKWAVNTSIFYRLFLASMCVAIVPGIIIALLGVDYIQGFSARSQAVQVSTDAVKLATTQLEDLQHLNADIISLHAERFVVGNGLGVQNTNFSKMEQGLNDEIGTLQASFGQQLVRYQQNYLITGSANMESVRSLLAGNSNFATITTIQGQVLDRVAKQEWQRYSQALEQDMQALQSAAPSVDQGPLPLVNTAYTVLESDWKQIVAVTETMGDEVAKVSPGQMNSLFLVTTIAIICILLVVGAAGYLVNFTVARPLRKLASLTRRIGQGDTSARAQVRGRDEIALVASSINSMLDNIVRLLNETQGQHEVLQNWIDQLVREVSRIGKGNLRVRAQVTTTPLGVLAEAFNYMVRELSGLVIRVKTSANAVHRSTGFIFQSMSKIVQTSNVQLKHITEAKVELGAMAKSSREVAERADMLAHASKEEQVIIHDGRIAVKKAMEAMQRIHEDVQETANKVKTLDEHSREISKILSVLSNVAQQTNFLAHDAASQAAIVGENGKGFSAVAADIQRLAERVKSQVSSVAEIVLTVNEDVRQTLAAMLDVEQKCAASTFLTQNVSSSLETIFASIERQAAEIASVNQMTTQQLQSFSVVDHMIQSIFASSQQVNAQAREATWTVESLARLVEALRKSVEVFELNE